MSPCSSSACRRGLSPLAARVISLTCAMQVTFLINGLLVFRCLKAASFLRQWAAYMSSNGLGTFCNYLIFASLVVEPGAAGVTALCGAGDRLGQRLRHQLRGVPADGVRPRPGGPAPASALRSRRTPPRRAEPVQDLAGQVWPASSRLRRSGPGAPVFPVRLLLRAGVAPVHALDQADVDDFASIGLAGPRLVDPAAGHGGAEGEGRGDRPLLFQAQLVALDLPAAVGAVQPPPRRRIGPVTLQPQLALPAVRIGRDDGRAERLVQQGQLLSSPGWSAARA